MLQPEDMYAWQRWLCYHLLHHDADPRELLWVWDIIGNIGKTWLAKMLVVEHGAMYVGGSEVRDILFQVAAAAVPPEIIIYNIPRSHGEINYEALESLKDGLFHAGKYKSNQCAMNNPRVLIFANEPPDFNAVSSDQWRVLNVTSDIATVPSLFSLGLPGLELFPDLYTYQNNERYRDHPMNELDDFVDLEDGGGGGNVNSDDPSEHEESPPASPLPRPDSEDDDIVFNSPFTRDGNNSSSVDEYSEQEKEDGRKSRNKSGNGGGIGSGSESGSSCTSSSSSDESEDDQTTQRTFPTTPNTSHTSLRVASSSGNIRRRRGAGDNVSFSRRLG